MISAKGHIKGEIVDDSVVVYSSEFREKITNEMEGILSKEIHFL